MFVAETHSEIRALEVLCAVLLRCSFCARVGVL